MTMQLLRSCTASQRPAAPAQAATGKASIITRSCRLLAARCKRQTVHRFPASSRRGSSVVVSASGDSQDAGADIKEMTKEEALEVLGLAPTSSFEQALSAKNKRLQRWGDDMEKAVQIETAYDVLLMDNMKQRLSGKADVAKSVRYADVPRPKKAVKPQPPTLPGGVVVARPPDRILATQSGVFALLAVWTLVQALTAQPSIDGLADTGAPGLQLAVAAGASVYFLRENKRLGLGRAAGLAAGGFVVGTIIGSILQNWLRVDIVPLGSFSSPGALVGELSILGLWFSCTFLR